MPIKTQQHFRLPKRRLSVIGAMSLVLLWFAGRAGVVGQPPLPTSPTHPYAVFLQRDPAAPTARLLVLVDGLSGQAQTITTTGERYTIFGRSVLYWDPQRSRVMRVSPDDVNPAPREHPFMQPDPGASAIDWVAAPDGKRLVWTITRRLGENQLMTITRTALADGGDLRDLLVDLREDGLRVMPVAFDHAQARLIVDYQPDGIAALTPYPQFAGLSQLAVGGGTLPTFLPGEPSGFTGAGFGGEYFLRLQLSADSTGFDLAVYNLVTGTDRLIPALQLREPFTQAGDVLIAADGTQAIYTLSQFIGGGSSQQPLNSTIVLVDLVNLTQAPLFSATTFLRPLAWTEDNSAILFTNPQEDGTWKVRLGVQGVPPRPEKIANVTYLGMLQTDS